jgi:hypothetical protein
MLNQGEESRGPPAEWSSLLGIQADRKQAGLHSNPGTPWIWSCQIGPLHLVDWQREKRPVWEHDRCPECITWEFAFLTPTGIERGQVLKGIGVFGRDQTCLLSKLDLPTKWFGGGGRHRLRSRCISEARDRIFDHEYSYKDCLLEISKVHISKGYIT